MVQKHKLIEVFNGKGKRALIRHDQQLAFSKKGFNARSIRVAEGRPLSASSGETISITTGENAESDEAPGPSHPLPGEPVEWIDGNNKLQVGTFDKLSSDPSIALVLKEGNTTPSKVPLAKLAPHSAD